MALWSAQRLTVTKTKVMREEVSELDLRIIQKLTMATILAVNLIATHHLTRSLHVHHDGLEPGSQSLSILLAGVVLVIGLIGAVYTAMKPNS